MSRYQIKVNSSGSWANLVSCPPDKLDAVKEACHQLARLLDHGIAFKVLDCASEQVVAFYNSHPRHGEPHGWHVPKQIGQP